MRISEKIISAIRDSFDTMLFFATMVVKEDFHNYIKRSGAIDMARSKCVAILGNGPSLKRELPQLIAQRAWEEKDILAVNFFALSEEFALIMPKYYVISDPMFFRKAGYGERVQELYKALAEKVSWPIKLYVQYYNPEHFDYRSAIGHNPNIEIVPFHSIVFHGFRSIEFWCYRRGLGSGNFGTVIQNGEFIALQLGYRRIELYGVDHTLLDGLMVDEKNRVCRRKSHYYDSEQSPAEPIYYNATNPPRPYTMSEYLSETAELFRGHEVLRDFSAECGAEIINRTAHSMIDAYKREPMI
ncbi:MAG: hypothetical protein IKY25_04580 [Alistipes sp.]|nr:hypothetical protein [Alistipes sp.]